MSKLKDEDEALKNQDIQKEMKNKLEEMIKDGREIGMQLCVYHQGELVVNTYAGIINTESKIPVTEQTLFPAFSTTKGFASTLLHILVERGKLDYEQRICEIWPEFAQNGKENILIKHALNHTAGVPHLPPNLTAADICNFEKMCEIVANQTPISAPGERQEYHAFTYGWIIGRLIELASKMSFTAFLEQEIKKPLGTDSIFVGVPDDVMATWPIATVYEPGFDKSNFNTEGYETYPECCMPMCEGINQKASLQACIPGVNGVFNALSMARLYAALLPGSPGVTNGIKLLTPETVKKISAVSSRLVTPEWTSTLGLGYFIGGYGKRETIFGHGGYGGSAAFADPEYDFSIGFTKNYFHPNGAELEIVKTVRELLDIPVD
ncbi:MAG: beta-lactamase family protein [Lachnospiraceae bacterium]|nr:beta-lactamase family protein [Lachnospiraceae bacterium]